MDNFENILLTDVIKDSLSKLLNRDMTALTLSSGTNFPQDVNKDMLGRLVNRTDLMTIYMLESVEPTKWRIVLDYSSYIPHADEIEAAYQPLNSNLTALARIGVTPNSFPYFIRPGEMSTLELNQFSSQLLTTESAEQVREMFGLGDLATKDIIDGAVDILNSSVTDNKLAFTPIKTGEGYSRGDIKETYSSTVEEGWIDYSKSIGNSESGAGYANDKAKDLYLMVWNYTYITVDGGKGSSAQADWDAGKKLSFPKKSPLLGNVNLRIKL
jgi:hypothetical protein